VVVGPKDRRKRGRERERERDRDGVRKRQVNKAKYVKLNIV
jgi:hypothetical protein